MATMEEIVAQIQTLRQELQESRRREEDLNTRLQAVQAFRSGSGNFGGDGEHAEGHLGSI